jgi:hypothetical protein
VQWLSQVCEWLAFQIQAISKHISSFFFLVGVFWLRIIAVCRSSDWSICSVFTGSMGKPCWLSSYWCYIISDYGLLPLLWRGSINCCTSFSGKSCKHLLVLNIRACWWQVICSVAAVTEQLNSWTWVACLYFHLTCCCDAFYSCLSLDFMEW